MAAPLVSGTLALAHSVGSSMTGLQIAEVAQEVGEVMEGLELRVRSGRMISSAQLVERVLQRVIAPGPMAAVSGTVVR